MLHLKDFASKKKSQCNQVNKSIEKILIRESRQFGVTVDRWLGSMTKLRIRDGCQTLTTLEALSWMCGDGQNAGYQYQPMNAKVVKDLGDSIPNTTMIKKHQFASSGDEISFTLI